MIVAAYGLVILYSAVEQQNAPIIAQSTKIAIAFVVMVVMAQMPPMFYLRLAPWLFLVGIGLLVAVLLFGYTSELRPKRI